MANASHYIIPHPVLNSLVEYLAAKPYKEVASLFDQLKELEPYQPAPSHPNDAAPRSNYPLGAIAPGEGYPEIQDSHT